MKFKTTKEIKVPSKIVDQIIGQDEAVNIIKKAAKQRRHVFLIGTPGTGKSMIGQALSELLPKSLLRDILVFPNEEDENEPIISEVKAGQGSSFVNSAKIKAQSFMKSRKLLYLVLGFIVLMIPWFIRSQYGDVMAAASLIGGFIFFGIIMLSLSMPQKNKKIVEPKLIVNNSGAKKAPFVDATGAKAGALLGDVRHDPFQSGGLATPAHLRVEAGMIHKANGGVLFIDEVSTLEPKSQQELLTAMQEKKFSITGQSERSAGALVKTKQVPCDFVLIAAGNLETVKNIHPALRSRLKGYGYEIYMNDYMEDNKENRDKLVRFVAQEVVKDGKIPHFTKKAVEEVISVARRMSGKKKKLTLRLRDLGGLVRAAGDLANERDHKVVTEKDVIDARKLSRGLEQQLADRVINDKKAYNVIKSKGEFVGRVNGLAVIGSNGNFSGIVLPIDGEVVPSESKKDRKIVATGQLGKIAKEAITNVSAIVKKWFNEDLKKYDVYVQFLQTYEGVEGDSASISVATCIISAIKNLPINQEVAMTGSLSVRGDVLPVGGVTQKVEAAIEAGMKKVIVPAANEKDIILSSNLKNKIKIIPATTLKDVLKEAINWKGNHAILKKIK